MRGRGAPSGRYRGPNSGGRWDSRRERLRQRYARVPAAQRRSKRPEAFPDEYSTFPPSKTPLDGEPVVLFALSDITERHLLEQRLRESEAQYDRMTRSFRDVYFELDGEGVVQTVSPSCEDRLSMQPGQLVGDSLRTLFEEPERFDELLRRVREDGMVENFEAKTRTAFGGTFPGAYHIVENRPFEPRWRRRRLPRDGPKH